MENQTTNPSLKKIYKPKSCEDCPVCKIVKGRVECGVARDLSASRIDYREKFEMWKKCPIAWDE